MSGIQQRNQVRLHDERNGFDCWLRDGLKTAFGPLESVPDDLIHLLDDLAAVTTRLPAARRD